MISNFHYNELGHFIWRIKSFSVHKMHTHMYFEEEYDFGSFQGELRNAIFSVTDALPVKLSPNFFRLLFLPFAMIG